MIHSWGNNCSASWAIVVWSSTTRSAARTLSQTDSSTDAVGRLVADASPRGISGPSTAVKISANEMLDAGRARR